MEKGRVDFSNYIEAILRRKWLALAVLVVTVASTLFYTLQVQPVYKATTTLIVDTFAEGALFDPRAYFWLWQPSEIAKHAEILKSRSLAWVVAQNLPEELRRMLPVAGEEAIASLIQGSMQIETDKNAEMIKVSVRTKDPETAAGLANAIASTYRSYNLTQRKAAVTAMREFIEEQLNISENRLNAAEQELQRFKESEAIASLDAQIQTQIANQVQFETAYQQAKVERETIERRLSYINSQIEGEHSGLVSELDDVSSPLVEGLKKTLTELELEKANLVLQGFAEDSPKVKAIEGQIAQAKESLKTQAGLLIPTGERIDPIGRLKTLVETAFNLRIEQQGQISKEKALKEVVRRYDRKLKDLPSQERIIARLTLDSDANRRLYMLLSEKREEARIQEAGKLPIIRIIDEALPPFSPIEPKRNRNLAMGFLLGLFLGIGLSYAVDYLDTSIKTPDDLERSAEVAPMASIPNLNSKGFLPFKRKKEEISRYLLTSMPPKSGGADAFRVLRTNLQYASVDRPTSSFLVTSSGIGEGKSLIATNLAISLAQMGSRTVLVDADLRKPVLHRVFGLEKEPGLTELIVDSKGFEEVVHQTDVENLSYISCGAIPPNTADLLNSKAAEGVFAKLDSQFDFVVYDTAPILVAADTPILAAKIENAIVVAKAKVTSRNALEGTLKTLSGLKARLLGVVLNGVDRGPRYSRSYYYYHDYKY